MITRRWQVYAARAAFVGLILVGMALLGMSGHRFRYVHESMSLADLALLGERLYEVIAGIQLTVVLLSAPAATAGAVCQDKVRGSLLQVMATDLTDTEIVLGKLAVRLAPVVGMVACVLPVMAVAGLLGGIVPQAMWGSLLVSLGVAILGCTLAFVFSVWGKKTYEVLLATYLVLIVWLLLPIVAWAMGTVNLASWTLLGELWRWRYWYHPYFLIYAPYLAPGIVELNDYLWFWAACAGLSMLLALLAIARVRAVTVRQASAPAMAQAPLGWPPLVLPGGFRARMGPSLDDNPVLWREWHRSRPSRFMQKVWLGFSLLALGSTAAAFYEIFQSSPGGRPGLIPELACAFQLVVGLLLLSVLAVTSLAEERARGSLDVLLTTPLSTLSILIGKWWGSYRIVLRICLLPLIVGAFLAVESGNWVRLGLLIALILAYGASVVSLGIALAAWIPRPSLALGLCVAIYGGVSVGWIFLAVLFESAQMAIGTPFYGAVFAVLGVRGERVGPGGLEGNLGFWLLFWIGIYVWLGFVLFQATWKSFDRCVGRISERGL
jgi:ABC-type transport system involved in multi-copper enzyme maturation permease subunit